MVPCRTSHGCAARRVPGSMGGTGAVRCSSLDLRLLIDREDRRADRRRQVQAGHVPDLAGQQRLPGRSGRSRCATAAARRPARSGALAGEMPTRRASSRLDQCVTPPGPPPRCAPPPPPPRGIGDCPPCGAQRRGDGDIGPPAAQRGRAGAGPQPPGPGPSAKTRRGFLLPEVVAPPAARTAPLAGSRLITVSGVEYPRAAQRCLHVTFISATSAILIRRLPIYI
jgi:hypothetical protein